MNALLKRALVLFALLAVLATPTIAAAQNEAPLHVAATQHISGNIATVTQDIVVDGDIAGDVTSWGGNITINGHVAGDVVSYAGRVVIAPSARIDGNVLAASGDIQGAVAHVTGQTLGSSHNGQALASVVNLFIPGPANPGPREISSTVFGALAIFFLTAFSLLWAALWPTRTSAAVATLRMVPGRAVLLGVLTMLLVAAALLPIAAVLAATVIGLPMLVLLLLLAQLPFLYGFTTLVQAIGVQRNTVLGGRAVLIAAVCAVCVGVILMLSPAGGLAAFYLLASPGLGAVILSRGGTSVPAAA